MDKRVEAIRNDKKIGRGTCSVIDECCTDEELIANLDAAGITQPAKAVRWAIDHEKLHREQALNARWGEDDDPELESYKESKDW